MSKQIIFVESIPNILNYKIAKALRERGYETILISLLKFDKKFYSEAYEKIISFDLNSFTINLKNFVDILIKSPKISKRLLEIQKLRPYATIGIASPYPLWLPALVRRIVKKSPFIYFPYDVNILKCDNIEGFNQMGVRDFELKAEKYLFENSDGILFKGGEQEFVSKRFNIGGKILNFPPYCSREFMAEVNRDKLSKRDGEIHFVYVGFLYTEDQINTLGIFPEWKEIIKHKMHLHAYHTQKEFIIESDSNKTYFRSRYFHVHPPIKPRELATEISKYDFGLHLSGLNSDIISNEFISTTIGNKMASYLEAGIPFIYNENQAFVCKIMSNYGLNLIVPEGETDIKKFIEKCKKNYPGIMKKIMDARNDFTVENHITRLIAFIDSLHQNNSA